MRKGQWGNVGTKTDKPNALSKLTTLTCKRVRDKFWERVGEKKTVRYQ